MEKEGGPGAGPLPLNVRRHVFGQGKIETPWGWAQDAEFWIRDRQQKQEEEELGGTVTLFDSSGRLRTEVANGEINPDETLGMNLEKK